MPNSNDETELTVQDQIKKLKHIRSAHKGRVTYFSNKLKESQYNSNGELESALNRLRITYSKFDEIQTKLEILSEEEFSYRNEFEDEYGFVEASILNQIEEIRTNAKSTQVKNDNSPQIDIKTSTSLKLPNIQLPKFDGSELNWLDFRGIFIELIHSNNGLSNLAKFHYLASCIRDGKAYKYIQPFSISIDNYPIAWKNLTDHYNDEIAIQKLHIKRIYEIKKPIENSVSSLQNFIDVIVKNHNSLKALKVPVDQWDLLLIHHLTDRLDDQSKIEIIKGSPAKEILSFEKFIEILRERCRIMEAKKSSTSSQQIERSPKSFIEKQPRVLSVQNLACVFCSGNHVINQCSKFKDNKLSPQDRYEFVKKHNLCTNCLRQTHRVIDCKSSPCSLCSLKHNILLHFGRNNSVMGISTNDSQKIPEKTSQATVVLNSAISQNSSSTLVPKHQKTQILLGTVVVWIRNSLGDRVQCRALLDSGSQANLITDNICKKLSLKSEPVHIRITGIGGTTSTVTRKVNVYIESRTSDFQCNLDCLVRPKISEFLPSYPVQYNKTMIKDHLQLADPWFYKPGAIDLLIGAEIYSEIMLGGKLETSHDLPMYKTVFGLVLMGKTIIGEPSSNNNSEISNTSTMVFSVFESLDEQIQKFWSIENIENPKTHSIEEKLCETHYSENVIRTKSGRYSVALPKKSNIGELGNSSITAAKQFCTMEKRLHNKPEFFEQYSQFMGEYIDLQHMIEVSNPDEIESKQHNYYMPHHAVTRESSSTTKLRVVFNASSKTSSNISLNDCLMVGPTIQQDLCSIIMRFRKHAIGITGDITKMYRQILVHEKDQNLQRIWWRKSNTTSLKSYKLRTVTYGTASAPFLAIRTLCQLAEDEQIHFPEASKVLKRDFYVDDVLTGADSLETAIKLKTDLVNLLLKGGFELRKITSNHSVVASSDPNDQSKSIKVLGINWNTSTDKFNFSFNKYAITDHSTKRTTLSEIAEMFDPLGLCAPIVFLAKSFMQTLWATKLGWDDLLPPQLQEYWNEFKRQLTTIDEISISRCVIVPNATSIKLHGFGDASEKGYGCVVYLRTIDHENNVFIKLLCSKSRVAPLKTQTIPRLELCASLLLAQIVEKIILIMQIKFNSIFLWTDSEITLHRIKSVPVRFEVFVANRISKIHDLSSPNDWYYVPTTENPADIVSRGLMPQEFLKSKHWWSGPSYINQLRLIIPKQPTTINNETSQMKHPDVLVGALEKIEEWMPVIKYSNYLKVLRIFAYIYRFTKACSNKLRTLNKLSKPPTIKSLEINEIDGALNFIIKHIQQSHYSDEIHNLRKNQSVSRRSKLLSLTPFLDDDGMVRVGGRLKNADIPFNHKHQFVVPGSHSFIKLLVRNEHIRLLHAGPQTLLYNLRQRFWVIGGRNLCRKIVRECITCARARPQTLNQIMGQLPEKRVLPSRPFQNVGIDFCGPFFAISQVKSRVQLKVYIAIFICFVTKAVHMEVVSDLSTSAFLASLRRFVSRRGLCSHIYSDNATNFIGSKSELKELRSLFLSEFHQSEVLKFCIDSHIQWDTIPPRSPHFGGLWEAAIKSAKYHIKRVLTYSSFSIEQLHTIVVQIEGCLNSRPIGPMSDNPNDFESLTPGHFLIGQPINSVPDPSLLHLKFNRLSHFQRIQFTFQTFWKRWSNEYLSSLQHRRKWTKPCESLKIGDLVILKEDNIPPLKWPMARIINLHKGQDGFVRVVNLKTSNSEFKRAITRICPLPIETSIDN